MNISISVEDDLWADYDLMGLVSLCADAVFESLKLSKHNIEICCLFTNDSEIRDLNKIYRGVDKATNVLSFPAINDIRFEKNGNELKIISNLSNSDLSDFMLDDVDIDNGLEQNTGAAEEQTMILGSIVIAYDVIKRESDEQKKKFLDHFQHLIIHSILHLLGYDHMDDGDAKSMENLEVNILSKLNIPNPY